MKLPLAGTHSVSLTPTLTNINVLQKQALMLYTSQYARENHDIQDEAGNLAKEADNAAVTGQPQATGTRT